jgi:hypothetical protein
MDALAHVHQWLPPSANRRAPGNWAGVHYCAAHHSLAHHGLLGYWCCGGCGVLAWLAIAHHRPETLPVLLGGVFLFWQFISINGMSIDAAISSFDPASLVRFPLPFSRYLVLRMLLGLLTPSTITGCVPCSLLPSGSGWPTIRLRWRRWWFWRSTRG